METTCDNEELRSLYLLNNAEGMYSDKLLTAYDYFGSFSDALSADAEDYMKAGIIKTKYCAENFKRMKADKGRLIERYYELEDQGIRLTAIMNDDYPERLRNIDTPPPLIYYSGRLPSSDRNSVGIIGARNCSEYGRSVAEFFAGELAGYGIQVVSGLASGIDGAAAKGSLDAMGESYGILGSGVNICYPKENWSMYQRMRNGEGGVISEFHPDAQALGYHFVMRNRLISGFSDCLLVIEAAEKSGTHTTVEYALNQGKEVFALPGRITDPLGYGCNRLLKEGAAVLTSPSDVLEYLGVDTGNAESVRMRKKDRGKMGADEKKVYNAMDFEAEHAENIALKAGLNLKTALTALAMLEAKGYIISTRAAYYKKVI